MVIPVHDVNPVRRTPVVTYALIAANIVVFLLGPVAFSFLGGTTPAESCRAEAYFDQWGAVPKEMLTGQPLPLAPTGEVGRDALGRVGCVVAPDTSPLNPFLTVLTSMFVHGGWAHVLGNMLFLYVFGNNVEDRLGRLRFLGFYLAAGYAAAYAHALLSSGSTDPLVGASGAIAGVLGAYLAMFPRARVWSLVPFFFFIPLRLPAWLVLGVWFVIQWFNASGAGIAGGADVAYTAHVAGFLVGLVVGAVVGGPPKGRAPRSTLPPFSPYDPPYGGPPRR